MINSGNPNRGFIQDGIDQVKRPELTRGVFLQSTGGRGERKSMRRYGPFYIIKDPTQ